MSYPCVALGSVRDQQVASPEHFHGHSYISSNEAIMVFLALRGSIIPLRVLESDSIESMKLRIQTCKGFIVKNQKLVCGGRELSRNNSIVRDYGIKDGNVLHLVLRLSDLQVINVKTTCGKEFTFHVERSQDVKYVKQQIAKKGNCLDENLEDQEVICNGVQLEDQRLIDDISMQSDSVIHLLIRKPAKIRGKPIEKNFELSIVASPLNDNKNVEIADAVPGNPLETNILLEPFIVNPKIELPSTIKDLISSTYDGLVKGNYPMMSLDGTGGAYFMPDSSGKKFVSVFKPMDEEPLATNNPRGLPVSKFGEGLKKGTRVGEGALREVAAYILDHPMSGRRSFSSIEWGFSGVPPTTLVRILHGGFYHPKDLMPKIGSLQMFLESSGSCEDMGYGAFPVSEVHKITVLDIRLANADRHAGNVLIRKDTNDGQITLVPIDHGYCLPECFEDCTFEWLYWPQSRHPYSPDTISYIKSLDAEEDIALLKFYGWDLPPECVRVLRISTMLLKKGVQRGLTPYEIGSMMCRETLTKESVMEKMIKEAEDSVLSGTGESSFLESVSEIMERWVDEIAQR